MMRLNTLISALATLAFALTTFAVSTATAHLMPAGKGTLNVVGSKAYVVLSLPVAAFSHAEPREGLTKAQLQQDENALRDQIRAGIRISSGDEQAKFTQVLLSLPTGADHDGEYGEDLIVMIVAQLKQPPDSIALSSDLWADELGSLNIQATVSEGAKTLKSEISTLSKNHPEFLFFASQDEVLLASIQRGFSHLVGGLDHLVFLVLVLLAAVNVRRWAQLVLTLAVSYAAAFYVSMFTSVPAPGDWIEVAIAGSVIVAAVMAAQTQSNRFYPLLVGGLGFLHGLGFAATVVQPGAEDHMPWVKMLGFNLGADLGQLVIAAALMGVIWLGTTIGPAFRPRLVRGASVLGGLVGTYWMIERALTL